MIVPMNKSRIKMVLTIITTRKYKIKAGCVCPWEKASPTSLLFKKAYIAVGQLPSAVHSNTSSMALANESKLP